MLQVESLQQQQQLSVTATDDDFSDDNDADDKLLAQAADILEKSYSECSDKLTETSSENREGTRPKHCQAGPSINTDTRTITPQTDRHTDNIKSLGAYGFTGTGTGYSVHHKKGDLFSCPQTDSLAHCVSKDLRMGKGIAVLFKQKFGGVTELKAQAIRIGEVGYLKRDDRYVYYLVTKAKYSDKPTYPSLESSLRSMKHRCMKHGVKRLSMPRIGCGLDRLVWNNVENILHKVFGDTNITITIYSI